MNAKPPRLIPTRQVLVRLPNDLYEALLRQSANETVARGKTVTVPKLIVEALNDGICLGNCSYSSSSGSSPDKF